MDLLPHKGRHGFPYRRLDPYTPPLSTGSHRDTLGYVDAVNTVTTGSHRDTLGYVDAANTDTGSAFPPGDR